MCRSTLARGSSSTGASASRRAAAPGHRHSEGGPLRGDGPQAPRPEGQVRRTSLAEVGPTAPQPRVPGRRGCCHYAPAPGGPVPARARPEGRLPRTGQTPTQSTRTNRPNTTPTQQTTKRRQAYARGRRLPPGCSTVRCYNLEVSRPDPNRAPGAGRRAPRSGRGGGGEIETPNQTRQAPPGSNRPRPQPAGEGSARLGNPRPKGGAPRGEGPRPAHQASSAAARRHLRLRLSNPRPNGNRSPRLCRARPPRPKQGPEP